MKLPLPLRPRRLGNFREGRLNDVEKKYFEEKIKKNSPVSPQIIRSPPDTPRPGDLTKRNVQCQCRRMVQKAITSKTTCATCTQSHRLPRFLPRDAMHRAVYAVARCPSVCSSHAGIPSKRLNMISPNFCKMAEIRRFENRYVEFQYGGRLGEFHGM